MLLTTFITLVASTKSVKPEEMTLKYMVDEDKYIAMNGYDIGLFAPEEITAKQLNADLLYNHGTLGTSRAFACSINDKLEVCQIPGDYISIAPIHNVPGGVLIKNKRGKCLTFIKGAPSSLHRGLLFEKCEHGEEKKKQVFIQGNFSDYVIQNAKDELTTESETVLIAAEESTSEAEGSTDAVESTEAV